MRNHANLAVLTVAAVLWATAPADAQTCPPVWAETMFDNSGIDAGAIFASIVFDDGTGPQLYVGGDTLLAGTVSSHCVRFNGSRWTAVGSLPGNVYEFAVYDPGTGPTLFACGEFVDLVNGNYSVRRWNPPNQSWVPVAYADNHVLTLGLFNDGSGPVLVAGGLFTAIGGVSCNRIARWNGATWSPFGAGADGSVRTIRAFDDGTGPKLYVGGGFSMMGGLPAACVARWSNGAWSALGAGFALPAAFPRVYTLEFFDDGGGARLYAGGEFVSSGGTTVNNVAKWTGTSWVPLGSGVTGALSNGTTQVDTLRAADLDGPGGAPPLLLAGGHFLNAGGAAIQHLAAWNGAVWTTALGQGASGNWLQRILTIPSPAGDLVVILGGFLAVDGISVRNVAVRVGGAWSPLNPGVTESPPGFPLLSGTVNSFAIWNGGPGPRLYAAGYLFLGGMPVGNYAVAWNGSSFVPVGLPFDAEVNVLKVLDLGSGPELYAAGNFTTIGAMSAGRVARWNGGSWVPVGSLGASVFDLVLYDDGTGPAIFAATAASLAKWNGSSWIAVPGAPAGAVYSLETFDPPGPQGPLLYAGGSFGAPFPYLTSFDGAVWSGVGSGVAGSGSSPAIRDLLVFDDGTGPALYAGGSISMVGGIPAYDVGRWDGSVWTGLGTPALIPANFSTVLSLGVFDDGGSPVLYAGGYALAGNPNGIAKRTGSNWTNVGGGLANGVYAIQAFDDGKGPALFAGGNIVSSGSGFQKRVAKLGCPEPRLALFQTGGVGSPVTIQNLGLTQGHEYYNFFSVEPCSIAVGDGPYLGLCASSLSPLLQQFSLPVGTAPFHFVHASPAQTATFGQYPLPPMTVDGICVDWTGGTLGKFSRVKRLTIY
jgi:hypothetical protein